MRMKLLFVITLFVAELGWAKKVDTNRKPDNYISKCEAQIDTKLKELRSKNEWIRVVDSKPDHKTFRTPTQVFGEWIEVAAGDEPSMYHITPQGIKEFGWKLSTCEMNKSTLFEPNKTFINIPGPIFTDADLKKIIYQKESVIIYTYSPRMTYSVKYIDDMASVAEKQGFKFIPVLDPVAKIEKLSKVFPNKRGFEIKKSASVEILMRQMLSHFPASLVIYRGVIVDPFIFGAMPKDEFEKQIVRRVLAAGNSGK